MAEKKKEDWMNSKWRPTMGWMYMSICMFDFMLAPILWTMIQALFHGGITSQWQPLTLQGAGLFHLAMGAVLGISAHGRTQEKLNGAEAGGVGSFGPGAGTTYVPPGQGSVSVNNSNQPPNSGGFGGSNGNFGSSAGGAPAFGAPQTGGFGSPSGFGSPAPAPASGFGSPSSAAPQVITGFGGKPGPAPIQDPIL